MSAKRRGKKCNSNDTVAKAEGMREQHILQMWRVRNDVCFTETPSAGNGSCIAPRVWAVLAGPDVLCMIRELSDQNERGVN